MLRLLDVVANFDEAVVAYDQGRERSWVSCNGRCLDGLPLVFGVSSLIKITFPLLQHGSVFVVRYNIHRKFKMSAVPRNNISLVLTEF